MIRNLYITMRQNEFFFRITHLFDWIWKRGAPIFAKANDETPIFFFWQKMWEN